MSIKGKIQDGFEFLMNSKSSKDGQLGEEYSSSTNGHKWDTTNWRQANQRCDTGAEEVKMQNCVVFVHTHMVPV